MRETRFVLASSTFLRSSIGKRNCLSWQFQIRPNQMSVRQTDEPLLLSGIEDVDPFLNRPSSRARSIPKVSLIVAIRLIAMYRAHPQFRIIGRGNHLDVTDSTTRVSVYKNLFIPTAVGAAESHMIL